MKIKKIEFENFRNFKERGCVECATDGKVTIVYGVNGAGKTTFHQLFQWIIYGTVRFNKTASDKMYNLELDRNANIDDKFTVFGQIEFEHAGVDYSMRREWTYQKTLFETKRLERTFTIIKKESGKDWVRLSNPEEVIEQLLPSGLKDYFFFDGESMITDLKAKGKDSAHSLKEALYLMLDLSIYDKAVDYIGSTELKTTTLGTLFMNKAGMGSSSALVTLGQKMESAQNSRDTQAETEQRIKDKISELQTKIQQISEKIGSAQSQRDYEAHRNEHKRSRDAYLEAAKREYEHFGEELISVFPKLMIAKVVEKASKKIKEQADGTKLVQGVNKELVDALLQEEVCICGTPLTEKEKAKLKELYKHLPPLGYDSLYRNFTDMAARWGKEYNREKIESYIKHALEYLELARQYNEAFTKKMFDVDLKWRLELISHLPDYILNEVADVRVLALGYASKRVKTLLKEYCKLLRREYKKVLNKAQIETDRVEGKLPKRIMANEYDELMVQRIYQKDGNIFLVFDSGTLKVVNGEIIEREETRLYHYKRKEPYSGWSRVLYAEVSYENGLFGIHLMIDNKDKKGQSKYWHLTVQGTSIIECRGSYLSYVPDFVKVEYSD